MKRILATTLVCMIDSNLIGLLTLRRSDLSKRFEARHPDATGQIGRTTPLHHQDARAFFEAELQRAWLTSADPVAVLAWVMNQVSVAEMPPPMPSAQAALQRARTGAGLLCGDMTQIYDHALAAAGHHSRRIPLVRSLINGTDTHVTREVLVAGRWLVFDPPFNVGYSRGTTLLGVVEIRDALMVSPAGFVEPVFYSAVAYPTRLESNYINWWSLNNDALINDEGTSNPLLLLPPFRYWYGPRYYYLETSTSPLRHVAGAHRLYLVIVVLLPLLMLLPVVGLAGVMVQEHVRRRELARSLRNVPEPRSQP